MNKFYLIKNLNINLNFVSNILYLCNGEKGILVSIFNCIFQTLMLDGDRQYMWHRKILNKIVDGKANAYKALHKILNEMGIKEYMHENKDIDIIEKFVCKEEKFINFLEYCIKLQAEILNELIMVIKYCESEEQLKILNCIYEIEKNNNDLFISLKEIKVNKKAVNK